MYIIGGLCDHNRLKMATYNRAKEEGKRIIQKFGRY